VELNCKSALMVGGPIFYGSLMSRKAVMGSGVAPLERRGLLSHLANLIHG
jgi:hypothetical protein